MKYQQYIIGTPDSTQAGGYRYRRFVVPVEERGGAWLPAGEAQEDTHLTDGPDMDFEIYLFRRLTDNTCGSLDDIDCPAGWRVLSRGWLPDDYKIPTPEEKRRSDEEGLKHLRDMGIID